MEGFGKDVQAIGKKNPGAAREGGLRVAAARLRPTHNGHPDPGPIVAR
jgi:hypothetical protein